MTVPLFELRDLLLDLGPLLAHLGDQFLDPGDAPEAEFKTDAADVTARAYCNLHGLWKG